MTTPPLRRPRGWILLTLKGLLTVIVLGVLFTLTSPADLVDALRLSTWHGIAAALACVPLHLALRVLRWKTLLADAGEQDGAARALRTVLVGYAFAVTTPAEVGEVVARVQMHEGVGGPRVVGLVMVEKLLHSMLALVPGIPALLLFATHDPWLAWLSAAILCAAVVTVLASRGRLVRLRFDEQWPRWTRVARTLREVGNVKASTVRKLALSTSLILGIYVLQEYLLINAVTTLGIVETWNGFWAGIGLRTLAPFFIGDLGVREASHVVFFGRYGIAPQAAMAASFLMFTVNIVLPALLGLVLLFFTKERARP